MSITKTRPEVLAPAGTLEKLKVAIIEYIKNCFPKNLYAIISKAVSIIRFATESSILNKFFKSNKSPNTPPSVILF